MIVNVDRYFSSFINLVLFRNDDSSYHVNVFYIVLKYE